MSYFTAKCTPTQFDFGCGSVPDAAGGAYSAYPDLVAGSKWPICKRKEVVEREEGKYEKKRAQGRGRKGQGQGRLNQWAHWARAEGPGLFFFFLCPPSGCGEINFLN